MACAEQSLAHAGEVKVRKPTGGIDNAPLIEEMATRPSRRSPDALYSRYEVRSTIMKAPRTIA
jgi:hypothetical protein